MVDDLHSSSGCPPDEVILAYLGERLVEEEAETLEAHYLSCDRCWREVHRGLEIRAGFAEESAAAASRSTSEASGDALRRPGGWALAAAVATALVAAGLWQLQRSGAPVVRGGEIGIELVAEADDGAISARWSPIPEADVYRVQLFTPDGRLIHEEETVATEIEREAGASPTSPAPAFVRVEALDSLRRVIASSDLAKVVSGAGERAPRP